MVDWAATKALIPDAKGARALYRKASVDAFLASRVSQRQEEDCDV